MDAMGVGVVGCGNIAPIYLQNLAAFPETRVIAVADLDLARAESRAREFGVAKATDLDGLLADPAVEIVLNLTTPLSHHEVAMRSLRAGKHVYNEKPIVIDVAEADEMLALAASEGLQVGCAPDTVLGAGIQTCRDLIDSGVIGEPLSFQAFMMCPGHEGWHPDPEFYYKKGGGPLFDMGPYYVSALVTLLGPVARVSGAAKKSFATRTIGSEPKRGDSFSVDVPTHLVTVMEMVSGTVGQLTTSFDVQFHTLPHIEVYGSLGTLSVPDPNGFGGPVLVRCKGDDEWRDAPVTRQFAENARGLGVRDMVLALREGRALRASGDLARHALAVFHAAHRAPHTGQYVAIEPVERPEAMPR
jgi:predicted dehydrogenase